LIEKEVPNAIKNAKRLGNKYNFKFFILLPLRFAMAIQVNLPLPIC